MCLVTLWTKWTTTMSGSPFSPWWYYEMGKDDAKHPNQEISTGAFVVIVICFILSLILFGGLIAACVWYFTS